LSEAQIKLWYRRFKDGWESVESDPRSGRPSTSRTPENVESVRAAIKENLRLIVRELEETLGIPRKITKDDYIEVLRRLRDTVRRKRPQLWASDD
jgi:transposase